VVTQTSISLNLQALFKTAAVRAGLSVPGGRVSGLSAPAKALFVAAAAREGLTILIVPADKDVDQMTSDVRFFMAALAGMSDAEVERFVLPFTSHEIDPYRGLEPHFEVAALRARALHRLASGTACILVASAPSLLPRLTAPAQALRTSITLRTGMDVPPQDLAALLSEAGLIREDPVDEHGEFCVRGGVVDIFPAGEPQPVRLEFIGDTIESIRRYDPATQRSVGLLDQVDVVPVREVFLEDRSATILDYALRTGRPPVFVSEPDEVKAQGLKLLDQTRASYEEAFERGGPLRQPESLLADWVDIEAQLLSGATMLEELGLEGATSDEATTRHVPCQPAIDLHGRIPDWVSEIQRGRQRGDTILFVAATPGRAERVIELLRDYELIALPVDQAEDTRAASVLVTTGLLSRGFRLSDAALQIYAETDVFEEERRVHERRRSLARTFLSDFRDLKVGDHVVHVDHGIGVFVGLKQIAVAGQPQEFMELRYAGEDKLFVPVERLDLIQKYTGSASPALDRLGGTSWERAKTRVKKAMRDMAEELLKLYAARKAVPGHAFSTDSHWQQEFEDAFEYELTPDQRTAIAEIKADMEQPSPMDRLLCGDVGYGKTEVAMRAAFKAVLDGKQVAFLAPTTVLAFQHLKTLRDRFAGFPVIIDMVSRFRSRAEQKEVLTALAAGRIDIIVGTHRLLSKDVQFRDLGLLVVDEEQRFGVAHKERIKQMRRRVDVLTMTATPIPRTLNMSLTGIRDMSIIETPPKDRLAIQTNVVRFDQQVIVQAIRHELERGGQVYVVHNRVESIYSIGNLLTRLIPEARVAVAHGQMGEDELERVMVDFVAHQYDVLLATTIIENGLDIPNANTLVVNRADRYGLAQLYQLRGRVGRSDRRAYAYLLIPQEESLAPVAKKRLAAIREFSDLGSGFRVAALDLEIRGAGNLLGGEQSGHIEAIGFDMYVKLLEQTVRELKGEELEDEVRATVNLKVDLRIDDQYIPDMNQRLTVYRRVAAARDERELEEVLAEVRDRYGPWPPSVLSLAEYGRIRVRADRLGVESIDREGPVLAIKFRQEAKVDPTRLIQLVQRRRDIALVPPAVLRFDLAKNAELAKQARVRRDPTPSRSWWTARATAGTVAPGFSKEEVLAAANPDALGAAVFQPLMTLLADLS
jgi:transcription-repair coupling factor (superfamily II helicase)